VNFEEETVTFFKNDRRINGGLFRNINYAIVPAVCLCGTEVEIVSCKWKLSEAL
jgi:hypothetical protein